MNKMMKIRNSVESTEESIEKSTALGAPYPSAAVGEVIRIKLTLSMTETLLTVPY
jgi:hypothetical protein